MQIDVGRTQTVSGGGIAICILEESQQEIIMVHRDACGFPHADHRGGALWGNPDDKSVIP